MRFFITEALPKTDGTRTTSYVPIARLRAVKSSASEYCLVSRANVRRSYNMNTRESIEGTRLQHAPCGAHRKALAIGLLSLAMTAFGGGSDSDGQASSSSSDGSS